MSVEKGSGSCAPSGSQPTPQETRYTFATPGDGAERLRARDAGAAARGRPRTTCRSASMASSPQVVRPGDAPQPVLEAAGDVARPEAKSTVTVREATGRPMTYTLAVVDEGLLSLTRFQTPDPGPHSTGARRWACGPGTSTTRCSAPMARTLERLLALGGDEAAGPPQGEPQANRFPPMVPLPGPLPPGGEGDADAPDRDPAVRGRGAGDGGGRARRGFRRGREVRLRAPAADAPRHAAARAGPRGEVALPVSVFALEPKVKDVALRVTTSGPLEVAAEAKKPLSFTAVGDEVVDFRLRTSRGSGWRRPPSPPRPGRRRPARRSRSTSAARPCA